MMTQDLAVQAGAQGICANRIAPEIILTELNAGRIPDATKAALVEEHPSDRLGTPEDVAQAALFVPIHERELSVCQARASIVGG